MKSFVDVINDIHPDVKKRNDRFHDTVFHKGSPDPLRGLALESGRLLDGDLHKKGVWGKNYDGVGATAKNLARHSFHDLLEILMPLFYDEIIDKHMTKKLRERHDDVHSFLKKYVKSRDNKIKTISQEMIKRTPHKSNHYDQALEYILENAINGLDEKVKWG
jgi:hypothetical protein